MLKIHWQRWKKTALILFAIFFVLFFGSLGGPAVFEICDQADASGAKNCSQHHFGPFVLMWVAGIGNAYNGLITAIATVLLTGITLRLARLEQESRDTQRAELRAYISAITKGITVGADGELLTIYIQLKNAGQTPAFQRHSPHRNRSTPANGKVSGGGY